MIHHERLSGEELLIELFGEKLHAI
jgi:hypothetical protein